MRRTPADLDALDRRILNALQEGFPLVPEPFAVVAAELGIDADDADRPPRAAAAPRRDHPLRPVLRRRGDGRRLLPLRHGGARRSGSTRWPSSSTPIPEVAHNYARAHRLNMWFVLATETPEAIAATADAIAAETGLAVLRLPKLEEFFIGFRVAA